MAEAPIMLIDDDATHLLITEKYLARAGVNRPVLKFQDSEQALEYLHGAMVADAPSALLPAVIFCDVRMPLVGGFELLAWVKKQRQLDGLPFVMLSSSEHPIDLANAKELGADDYLIKFPSPATFAAVLQKTIRD